MLSYVLFHEEPYQRFVDFLRHEGLAPTARLEDGTYEVTLPEDTEEALLERIEDRYDELMDLNQRLIGDEHAAGGDHYHAAGVVVNLRDGQAVYADVAPALLNKIMQLLTPEELGELVNAIADAVESPDTRTLCQRMRDGDGNG